MCCTHLMHTITEGIKKTEHYDTKEKKKTIQGTVICEIIALLIITKDYNNFKEIFRNFCIILKNPLTNTDVVNSLKSIVLLKDIKKEIDKAESVAYEYDNIRSSKFEVDKSKYEAYDTDGKPTIYKSSPFYDDLQKIYEDIDVYCYGDSGEEN